MSTAPKTKIYIHADGATGYWKICEDMVGGRNTYGIIDTEGFISAKKGKLPYFPSLPGFEESKTGKSRKGGPDYIGWAPFGSFEEAIKYLEKYFEVRIIRK
jgi:hypothetical protein